MQEMPGLHEEDIKINAYDEKLERKQQTMHKENITR
jgi:HSP20 family molecular chaperone IbpA